MAVIICVEERCQDLVLPGSEVFIFLDVSECSSWKRYAVTIKGELQWE